MSSNWYEWIFSGIGTSILSGLIGLLVGSIGTFQIYKHKSKIKQIQKSGKDSKQKQIGSKAVVGNNSKVTQTQEAKDNAEQIQIGEQ